MSDGDPPARARRRPAGNPPPPEAAPFYGRRKGKALRDHHAALMRDLLPKVAVDIAGLGGGPQGQFGRPFAEFRLEIGFGGAERLALEAAANPNIGFIGCEPFVNGIAKALALIEARGLDNLRLHAGEAGRLVEALPEGALSRIELLYPDPWPKRRHRKRRFVSDAMIARLARLLRPGGEWRFATDIDDYAAWTLARVAKSREFEWRATRPADWLVPWEGWAPTRYEAKARAAGRSSVYATFVRNNS